MSDGAGGGDAGPDEGGDGGVSVNVAEILVGLRNDITDLQDQVLTLRLELDETKGKLAAVEAAAQGNSRQGSGSGGGRRRGGSRRRPIFPEHDPVTGRPRQNGLQWAVHPFRLRYSRRLYHFRNRLRRWLVGFVVWLVVTGVAVVVWGPGSPWAPDLEELCGTAGLKVADKARVAEPAAVRGARLNGRLLRGLAGPPPAPAETRAAAERLGRSVVVGVLALRSTARGAKDPAAVSSYNAEYRKRDAGKRTAQVAASCAPVCPGVEGPGDGTMTVAYRPTGANPAWAETARRAAVAAKFRGRKLEIALRVAWLESQFKATARNPAPPHALGVWQIARDAHGNDPDIGAWTDPYASARMAWRISKGGTDWSPWAVWPRVQREMAAAGPGVQVASRVPAADIQPCQQNGPVGSYTGGATEGAWGGYRNGRIPATALAHPRSAPGHLFRPDAAAAFDRLSAAYRARFGRPLGVSDSYRDLAGQVAAKAAKRGLAATPGTSNHGWGLAADVVVGGYTDARYSWMREHAPGFGWDNPGWARPGGSKREPWHWEFNPGGAST